MEVLTSGYEFTSSFVMFFLLSIFDLQVTQAAAIFERAKRASKLLELFCFSAFFLPFFEQ